MDLRRTESKLTPSTQDSARPACGFQIERLDHLVITVADIDKTIHFYTTVLGMEETRVRGPRAVNFGQSRITIHQYGREFLPKSKRPTPGSADLCFFTSTKLDTVIQHIKKCNVYILEGPVSRPGALGRMTSIYIKDPDENLIEICNYP